MEFRRTLISGAFTMALAGASAAAMAVPIATTGGADTLVAATNQIPNDANEKNFLASLIGADPNTLEYTKFAGSAGEDGNWQQVTGGPAGTDLWAWDFDGLQPLAYLIKTGANVCLLDGSSIGADSCPTTYDTYGYLNDASLNWAVIDLAIFGRTRGGVEIGFVSHISSGGNGDRPPGQIPEPGSLLLLGAGLAGLALMRRRRWI